ncbi:disulfide bond formation protein DsbA [Alsobacter soli]|uniref:Disulfide bond formation protein DsbA n=1 Tax=Alsobacter soli TaxID=2109933 RepID=A0A2T1HVZ0_9HYPH|nr:DsbA family protein [Alsobacter soli]PSC05795.1 disulfide bond formation protein DsbA [Alsobacter soli]
MALSAALPFLRKAGLALALAGAAAAPLPAVAQNKPADFTDAQKSAIRDLVKSYLMENPEVIQDALVELDKRQKEAEKTATKTALGQVAQTLTQSPRNIVVGNPQGDVTLVEFFDYNCGYCKKSLADMRELAKTDPKLRIVIRDFPVLGPDSVEASFVAVAAKSQIKPDRYFDFHQKLLESKGRVGKDRALAVAKEFGADQAKLEKDMQGQDVRASIEETMRLADILKLQGTPAFIVGDDVIFGSQGIEPLRQAIAAVRQCGKASC